MLYFPDQGCRMKREKSLWTDCFASPKTNSCYLQSGLNELCPLGSAARLWGMLSFNQGKGKIQEILMALVQAGQHLDYSLSLLQDFEFV